MTKIAQVTRRKQSGFLFGKANEMRIDIHVGLQEHNWNGLADGAGNQGVRYLASALQDETVDAAAADHPRQSCVAFGPGSGIAQEHSHSLPGGLLLAPRKISPYTGLAMSCTTTAMAPERDEARDCATTLGE